MSPAAVQQRKKEEGRKEAEGT
jgi:hypothetical protein